MPPIINAYSHRTQFTDLAEAIAARWNERFDLVNVEYGDGIWFSVFGEDIGQSSYTDQTDFSEFTQAISDKWDEGFDLVDVGYGNGRWVAVFNDGFTFNRTAYSTQAELTAFTQAISDRWDEGFRLIDVEYGDGTWFGVFEEDTYANAYATDDTLNDFTQSIAERWEDDHDLIDVEYGNGTWFGVFRGNQPGRNAYEVHSSLSEFEEAIALRQEQRYELIDTAYGDGTWFGVFQQGPEDDYEDNDTLATAYDLSFRERTWLSDIKGLGQQYDDDWYKIDITRGYERIVANLNFTHVEGDIDLALYDADGQFITNSISATDNESIDTVVDNPGTYYLRVYYEDVGNTYDLWWDDRSNTPSNASPPIAQPSPSNSDFNIQVRFSDTSLTPTQQAAFTKAADRWSQVIIGDLTNVVLQDVDLLPGVDIIDDIVINARALDIDGPSGILGRAAPTHARSDSGLPYLGRMEFDIADLDRLEDDGSLIDVILHEMGHVLGIGSLWDNFGLLDLSNPADPRFTGAFATAEYNALFGVNESSVPVESEGGAGTALSHWRDDLFGNELMTGFIDRGINPLSRISIASLVDIGYTVNLDAADLYTPTDDALLGSDDHHHQHDHGDDDLLAGGLGAIVEPGAHGLESGGGDRPVMGPIQNIDLISGIGDSHHSIASSEDLVGGTELLSANPYFGRSQVSRSHFGRSHFGRSHFDSSFVA